MPQPLAVLLKQLNAKSSASLTGCACCVSPSRWRHPDDQRQLWRIQNSQTRAGRPTFYGNSPFLSATGIERSWVCTAPARVLE
ncbi:hypothetical protein [Synechococcus sp. LTW-R]|uniref:hypothetical protein n=1 Tax=Synechococcus sp. LTW-R TaxID=2751170 RepID=UPI001626E7F9|nr:hypothetical protein [Synechococcus sp. LTW-R]QNG29810.1 hypothetical protein H0O22_01065 [Synechococcus sp. LTW-R]